MKAGELLNYRITRLRRGFSNYQSAFTLIELLIVIAIIGILAALIVVSLVGAQAKGRDAKRKTNARNIASALAQYHQDNALTFPSQNVAGGTDITTAIGAVNGPLVPTYLASNSVFIHDKVAKYITDNTATYYTQAWELENTTEATVNTGNGVYATSSANASGIVAVPLAKGTGISFNGSNTTVTVNEPGSGTNLHPAAFSVSFWLNPSSITGTHAIIHKNTANVGWRVWLNGANINADYQGVAGTATHSTNLVVGTWYHVVVTYTSGSVIIYVNGTAGTAAAPAFNNTTNANPIMIGGVPGGSGWTAFAGTVDGLRLYNRVLTSPAEVGYLYNSGSGSYGSPNEISSVSPPLLLGLRFDEGTGTALANYTTATTATGTLANGSWTTGNAPLGLTGIGTNILGRAYVTYGPN